MTLVAALALTAGVAQAALGGSGPKPAPKALAGAILAAFNAAEPEGLTAKIEFTNDLLPSGSLPSGTASALLSGADGRLWIQKGGDVRIELQSDAGDAQIVAVGDRVTVYDASAQTVYRATLPDHPARGARRGHPAEETLTLANVQKALNRLAQTWTLSGAEPTSTAGRPTYTVRMSPKDDRGLLGAAALAWDSVRGAPLRAAIYAEGRAQPVLELKATDVSYDAVADSDVRVAPPAAAEVVDLDPSSGAQSLAHERGSKPRRRSSLEGVGAVRRAVGFTLRAPATLGGLPRRSVRLVTFDGEQGALAIYGKGMGAVAVLQHAVDPAAEKLGERDGRRPLRLPQINIGGAIASQLETALGTIVTFERDDIAYLVAGSLPAAGVESAARGLR